VKSVSDRRKTNGDISGRSGEKPRANDLTGSIQQRHLSVVCEFWTVTWGASGLAIVDLPYPTGRHSVTLGIVPYMGSGHMRLQPANR
jgi:hypothetical protein